ncbi:MAG: TRAP transporter small permease [Burkholderiaceae bacterium]|nr:TRAP transporter small permease [Burkholderiaceae bacterium]
MYAALQWVGRRAMFVAGLCYLLITLLICFDIAARHLLGFSSEATIELTGYMMAVGMTWGLAGTLFERGHVRIDVLVQKMPLRVRVWLHLLSLTALIVSTGFYTWGAVSLARESLAFNATDLSTLRTPLVIPQGLWAAGFALLLLAALALALRAVRQLAHGQYDAMDQALMARTYVDEAAETLEAVAEAQATMHLPVDRPGPTR